VQDGIGAVVGLLQGWDDIATVHPDKGGMKKVPRKLLCQLAA
jgi:hypothetical protein